MRFFLLAAVAVAEFPRAMQRLALSARPLFQLAAVPRLGSAPERVLVASHRSLLFVCERSCFDAVVL